MQSGPPASFMVETTSWRASLMEDFSFLGFPIFKSSREREKKRGKFIIQEKERGTHLPEKDRLNLKLESQSFRASLIFALGRKSLHSSSFSSIMVCA